MQIASSSLRTMFAEQDPKSMNGEEFLEDAGILSDEFKAV